MLWLGWSALLIFATIVIGGGVSARRRLPDLQPWHRIVLRDLRAGDVTARSTLNSCPHGCVEHAFNSQTSIEQT